MTDLIAELAEVVRLYRKAAGMKFGNAAVRALAKVDDRAATFVCTHHATLTRIIESEATLSAEHEALVIRLGEVTEKLEASKRDARGERGETWEVWQEDMPRAVSDSLPDATHYLAMYQQDGPVTLNRAIVYRETITPGQLAAMHDSAREGGES